MRSDLILKTLLHLLLLLMLINKNIKLLVIHCSDTEDSEILNAIDIHKMHLNFGWDGIGYHKVICRSGKIENGRPEYWVGAHVKGKNDISLNNIFSSKPLY